MLYIGIDPGLNGAWMALDSSTGEIQTWGLMPRVGDEVDTAQLVLDFKCWGGILHLIRCVVVERQQAFPKDGAASAWRCGYNYGLLLQALRHQKLQILNPMPKQWQKFMLAGRAKSGDTKADALLAARDLWPNQDWRATPRCKKAHDGLVDAALIAEYGRRSLESLLS